MKLFNHDNRDYRGITIVEVMIVVMIISMAFIGLMSLNSLSLQAMYISRNTLTASQLAQEAVEIIRNKRDQNWLDMSSDGAANWDDNLSHIDAGTAKFFAVDYLGSIDPIETDVEDTALSNSKAQVKINSSGYYALSTSPGGKDTIFRRVVQVSTTTEAIKIIAVVRYNEHGRIQRYKLQTELYNWR